jgi:phenylacetate-CoA ligase
MQSERPYWNMQIEPFLHTAEMKNLQLDKLKIMLKRLHANAPFFQKRMDAANLKIDKLNNLEAFSKSIPVYDKAGFREHVEECGGDLLKLMNEEMAVNVEDLSLINSTTGTTGEPVPYPLTMNDINGAWGESLCRGSWRAGLRPHDRVLFCFALSMYLAGTGTMMGFQKMGATMLPVGAESGTERIMQMAKYFKPTAFAGTPSLAMFLREKMETAGLDPKAIGLKYLFCAGEAGAGVPEIREKIIKGYNAKLFDFGAGFGMSCDHDEYQGMHWLCDDYCIYELVDPNTREPIPLVDGAQGEAVFTTIDGDGWIWLRTSIGDIHEVTVSPCPCGKTGLRYKVIGRTDDMLKIKGVMLYPAAVAGMLQSFVPQITGEFRIVLTERPPLVSPPLKIKIEKGSDYPKEKLPELEKTLLEAFHNKLKIRPSIIWQESGELERSTYKGKKFENLY